MQSELDGGGERGSGSHTIEISQCISNRLKSYNFILARFCPLGVGQLRIGLE